MKSLAGRVALLVTITAAVVFVVVGVLLMAEVGRRERATFDRELRATVNRMVVPARRDRTGQLDRLAGDASVRLLTQGRVSYDNGRAPELPVPRTGLRTLTAADGSRWRVLRRGRLIVARPLQVVEDRIDDLQNTIALAALLGLVVTAIAVRLVAARSLRPLSSLREQAAGITTTRARVDESGPAEVGEVAHALNAMLARLEESVAATERFTADAGHELRTPLTSVRANLAALRHGPDDKVLAELERDVARLAALLDGLQALARGDAGAVAREPVDVGDVADAALADARRRHPEVDFAFGEAHELTVTGDATGIRAILDNLLENAARHGASTVRIELGAHHIAVDDDGPGIPPDRRERVFERFVHAGAGGSGLGLAIVAQQAQLHGGEARIEDSPLGGARVLVTMRA
ncbi:HAMP domain-containing histidine kinase [Solirubrobacter sp. CPCC 204708]|uniref:histidine kinase n=1 Tax=Solirubrobacter deserti TaxID=2282478 RepID=A0ABT4RLC8_9ACTN|nr:HAMP domain-containing sensor histidine kinase [Solirubrobacter deserti]MBE2319017.1 HAMP domain-containing histidine kinase [Solirubrobacter deserti]MDA0139258.1 HAMP domain-containing histidine kinase [Solirubrobacter deserti]